MGKDGVAEDDEQELARGFSDEVDAEKRKFLARARFAEFKDRQVQKRKLKGSAAFEKVWTPRNRDPQTKGKAYVYFYPQGQADRAQIPVADGGNVYTVVTQPLTGRARVVTGHPRGAAVRRVRCQRRGFTLLEVMVALAVLAGSLMAVADLSGNALRNFGYARDLSVATLLARGKMAELEEKYEDVGFTDFDQTEEGTFADQGQPGMRWKLELQKPTSDLTPEKILGAFLGGGDGDVGTQEMLGKLLGGAGAEPAAAPREGRRRARRAACWAASCRGRSRPSPRSSRRGSAGSRCG